MCSPELAQIAICNSTSLDFARLAIEASRRMLNLSKKAMDIIAYEPPIKGGSCYANDLHAAMYASLSQGPTLLNSNARVLNCAARYINDIDSDYTPVNLYEWVKDIFTVASAETLFGPKNPISDNPELITSVWYVSSRHCHRVAKILPFANTSIIGT